MAKNDFFLFAKCLKIYRIFAFAFKVCKKWYYDPKNFFLKNISTGIKKTRILCWVQILWCRLSEMPLTKGKSKKPRKMHKNENTQNSHSFLALAFFRGIYLSRHQQIWNQHKILRFLYLYWYFSRKIFWDHNSTFCIP